LRELTTAKEVKRNGMTRLPKLIASVFPAYADLNFPSRPVRTCTPGGVGEAGFR
jgi:hypothetical protein